MRKTLTYNIWTKEEENKLKSLVGTTSFSKMVKYFPNRTELSLFKKAIKLGYFSKYKHHKYEVNKDYWKELDLIKCYYGGFFASDGNLDSRYNIFKINLNIKDLSLLENFKKECKYTGKIEIYKRKKYKSDDLMEVCHLRISCGINQWYKDLYKHFNITPKKSFTLQPPNIKDLYLKYSYLIGLLDGDGWICIKNNNYGRVAIGYVSASKIMIEWVKTIFESIIGEINLKIQKGKGNYYYFVIDNKDSLVIIDYLRQFPVPKLNRRWNNPLIIQKIEEYKKDSPELFKTLNPSEIQHLLPNSISQL